MAHQRRPGAVSFLRRWRRDRVLSRHSVDESLWRKASRDLPFLSRLSTAQTRRLQELALLLLDEKEITATHGLEITDPMRLSIAAQACLPILELGLDWYRGWRGIVVYPGDFRVHRQDVDEAGVVHEWDDELAGEAMHGGPVVLSWDAASHDGEINVVIHEFAHKLDMLNGEADGLPPLHAGMDRNAWRSTFMEAYEGLCDALERGRQTWLDPYAAEHPAEFFAVMSEAFFTKPDETRRRYPAVYEQLARFFRQDPARRTAE